MKTLKRERGQSLVELSISLLVLLYLLSGAVEFGIAFFQYVQLRDAAQEGALYGSMSPGPSPTTGTAPGTWAAVETRVRNASSSPINLTDTSQVHVSVYVNNVLVWKDGAAQNSTSEACEGNALNVTVAYNHKVFMPFMSKIIGSTVPLDATVTDTILYPKC